MQLQEIEKQQIFRGLESCPTYTEQRVYGYEDANSGRVIYCLIQK